MKLFKDIFTKGYIEKSLCDLIFPPDSHYIMSVSSYKLWKKYKPYGFTGKSYTVNNISIQCLINNIRNSLRNSDKYKHTSSNFIYILKEPIEGLELTTRQPENEEFYRKIILLNRKDALIHIILSKVLSELLYKKNIICKIKSQGKTISEATEMIKDSNKNNRIYFLKTDIKDFNPSFDIDLSLNYLFNSIKKYCDDEDEQLFRNIILSYLGHCKEYGTRCGSPLIQLLGELILNIIEQEISKKIREKDIDCKFLRKGEDFLFFTNNSENIEWIYEQLGLIGKEKAGNNVLLHKLNISNFKEPEKENYYVPIPIPNEESGNISKSIYNELNKSGFEFCGYYYELKDGEVKIAVRNMTMEKLALRIRYYTQRKKWNKSDYPEELNEYDKKMIKKLNLLFGYIWYKNKYTYKNKLGCPEIFTVVPNWSNPDSIVYKQAQKLNHLMYRRIRHLYGCDVPGYCEKKKIVDNSFRKYGLKTLIDALNCKKTFQ